MQLVELYNTYTFFLIFSSNNMLYPKEDKEHKVLLYAVSKMYLLFFNITVYCI